MARIHRIPMLTFTVYNLSDPAFEPGIDHIPILTFTVYNLSDPAFNPGNNLPVSRFDPFSGELCGEGFARPLNT